MVLLGLFPFVPVLTKSGSVVGVASLLVCLVLSVVSVLFLFLSLFVCCTAAALNVVFLRLGFVGTLSVRSCSHET